MTYGTLRRIPIKNLESNLEIFYSPKPAPTRFDKEKLNGHSPAKYIVQDKLNQQPEDRLQCSFASYSSKDVLPLAVMRNRLNRRWSEALRTALKEHGYAHNGRRPATKPDASRRAGLAGTVSVVIHNAAGWNESSAFLQRNANAIVKAIIQQSSRYASTI